MPQDNKIALLIDCDNVSHKSIEGVIDELSKYGKVNIRHAYGNWTSDSDFTPLVMRILSNGITVYGFGEKKTPMPFVKACSQFIFTENLEQIEEEEKTENTSTKKSRNELRQDGGLVKLLRTAVEQNADEDGWSHLGLVGQYISNKTSFSPVNYGYKKLSDLIRVSDLFEIKMRDDNSGMYIKDSRK
ncbi:MAG: uncharacterized LabA/DUF88 family protein [Desulforhopalus sp.]|jgi:uncharacterized LabA/DUF88 family protein